MKKSIACQLLVISVVWLTSCHSERATFYFSSRPVALAVPTAATPAPSVQAQPLPLPPAPQALPSRSYKQAATHTPKRLAVVTQVAAAPLTAVQKLVPRPSTLQHASKRPYAPKEGGAKAVGAILKMLSVVALLLGAGLVVAGFATSSVGVGGIILGAILFVAGLVVLIDVSKY